MEQVTTKLEKSDMERFKKFIEKENFPSRYSALKTIVKEFLEERELVERRGKTTDGEENKAGKEQKEGGEKSEFGELIKILEEEYVE